MREANLWQKFVYWLMKPEAIKIDRLKEYGWNFYRDKLRQDYEGKYFDCPMKSGKRAILRCYEFECTYDPNDMYIIHYEFIKYISEERAERKELK